MHRMPKLIHASPSNQLIPLLPQELHIPGQGRRVAAHIHDPLRLHIHHGLKQRFFASFPRRVHYDHVCVGIPPMLFLVLRIILRQHFFCLAHIEPGILDPIDFRVIPGVLDSLGHDLHAIDFLGLLRQEQGYGSDAAVDVPDRLFAGKPGVLKRQSIQFLRLDRIYLVKGQRRDLILYICYIVCNVGFPPQGLDLAL